MDDPRNRIIGSWNDRDVLEGPSLIAELTEVIAPANEMAEMFRRRV